MFLSTVESEDGCRLGPSLRPGAIAPKSHFHGWRVRQNHPKGSTDASVAVARALEVLEKRPSHHNKDFQMKRRNVLLAAGATMAFAGCSTTSSGGATDPAAKRREIEAAVDNALSQLYANVPGARDLAAKSSGMLVFPRVVSAGFVVGGSYGEGALRKGAISSSYYSVGAGSVGLLAGAQSKAMYLLFMTPESLRKFEASAGWTAGADASVALAEMGADARIDTKTAQAPIIGFVRNNAGLMANLSLDGTKFTKLTL